MNSLKVLIADPDVSFAKELQSYLKHRNSFLNVICAHTDFDALNMLIAGGVDYLITDAGLRINGQCDAFNKEGIPNPETVLDAALVHSIRRKLVGILVVGDIDCSNRVKVTHYMPKPVDPEHVYALLTGYSTYAGISERERVMVYDRATIMMLRVGISAHYTGFAFIRDAIVRMYYMGSDCSIIGDTYPAIAKRYGCTPNQVDRCIRNAIDSIAARHSPDYLTSVTGVGMFRKNRTPSNTEFISAIAERISLEITRLSPLAFRDLIQKHEQQHG